MACNEEAESCTRLTLFQFRTEKRGSRSCEYHTQQHAVSVYTRFCAEGHDVASGDSVLVRQVAGYVRAGEVQLMVSDTLAGFCFNLKI